MIQFGLGTMQADSLTFGYLQNVSIDFSFEEATLHGGTSLYPVDVQVHSASIEGSAEAADINTSMLAKVMGGTQSDGSLPILHTDKPPDWSLSWTMTTDEETFTMAANKCKSSKLGLSFERENYVIPNFDFSIYKDPASETVFTITCTDWS